MGYYIPVVDGGNNAERIVKKYHGELLPAQPKWDDIPKDKVLVVVVDNGIFEAAGLAYDSVEYERFTMVTDRRPKQYVLLDKETAYKAAGFDQQKKRA
jgi:hypothetical protein